MAGSGIGAGLDRLRPESGELPLEDVPSYLLTIASATELSAPGGMLRIASMLPVLTGGWDPAGPNGGPGRVLLVDDDPGGAKLIRVLLEVNGYEVVVAADGVAALRCARLGCFDLVLMDVHLPDQSGVEMLAALRLYPALIDVPIVAVTAMAMAGDREALLGRGFDHYIAKPIDVRTFVQELAARSWTAQGSTAFGRPAGRSSTVRSVGRKPKLA